jgi:methionyl-tRNA formyltransferase
MRIVFITDDDVFYLPAVFSRVLGRWADETVALALLPPMRSMSRTIRRSYDLYGPFWFALNSARYVTRRLGSRLGLWLRGRSDWSVAGIAGRYHIPVYRPASVNGRDFLDQLRYHLRPDVIVSVSASQIFRDELLELPPLGCVNVHGALLPRYRGMMPSFWTLLHGEPEGGVTAHYMSPGIDEGRIIAQRRFPILAGDTVESVLRRSKATAADLLVEVLGQLRDGTVTTTPNPLDEGTYHTFPSRQDVQRLRALGRRVI